MNLKSLFENREPLRVNATSFSWSRSRNSLFDLCKRAYFYNYYGAAGGWDQYASAPAAQLYRLKGLRTAEEWACDVFTQAVQHVFTSRRPVAFPPDKALVQLLSRRLHQIFQHGYADIICEKWREDHKALKLFEIYYADSPGREEQILTYCKQRIAQHLAAFSSTGLFSHLAATDAIYFRNFQSPVNFMLGDLEVWAAPTLIWQDEDRLKVLAVKPGTPGLPKAMQLHSAIFGMMAQQLFHGRQGGVDTVFYYTGAANCKPEIIVHEPVNDYSDAIAQIRASADKMLDKIYPDNSVHEEDFSAWEVAVKHICGQCRFKEFCNPLNVIRTEIQ